MCIGEGDSDAGKYWSQVLRPGCCFRSGTRRKSAAALTTKLQVLLKLIEDYLSHRQQDTRVEQVAVTVETSPCEGAASSSSEETVPCPVPDEFNILFADMSEEWQQLVEQYDVNVEPFFRNPGTHVCGLLLPLLLTS